MWLILQITNPINIVDNHCSQVTTVVDIKVFYKIQVILLAVSSHMYVYGKGYICKKLTIFKMYKV